MLPSQISFGGNHAAFLTHDGDVWCFGDPSMGQFGCRIAEGYEPNVPFRLFHIKESAIKISCKFPLNVS